MKLIDTGIKDVICFEPAVFGDERGFFMETYRDTWLTDLGVGNVNFVQDNHSASHKGILRGLHYQIQQPQGKLVRVIQGSVFDVAVDLRRNSPTYLQWASMHLSSDNKRIMWVPPGFAHGFLVTSDIAEFVYKCTDYYAPQHERTLQWNDPALNIPWPLQDIDNLTLSEKDQRGTPLEQVEVFEDNVAKSKTL